jgi:hypothetical protein
MKRDHITDYWCYPGPRRPFLHLHQCTWWTCQLYFTLAVPQLQRCLWVQMHDADYNGNSVRSPWQLNMFSTNGILLASALDLHAWSSELDNENEYLGHANWQLEEI